eukprot:366326-Chlamydomonas_euryale.AAC.6
MPSRTWSPALQAANGHAQTMSEEFAAAAPGCCDSSDVTCMQMYERCACHIPAFSAARCGHVASVDDGQSMPLSIHLHLDHLDFISFQSYHQSNNVQLPPPVACKAMNVLCSLSFLRTFILMSTGSISGCLPYVVYPLSCC